MNINQFKDFFRAHVKSGAKTTLYLQGPSGAGKSSAIQQLVDEFEYDYFCDLRLGMMDPLELKGVNIPVPEEKITIATLPNYFPTDPDAKGILLLDEFDHAPPSMQSAAYQIILDRRIGEFKLPDGVMVIMASNRKKDKGVHFNVPDPIKNRVIQVEVLASHDEWLTWGHENDINPSLLAFIDANGKYLYHKSSEKAANDMGAFCSPRSWSVTSHVINSNYPEETLTEVLNGTIGNEATDEFLRFKFINENNIDVDSILNDKFEVTEDINIGSIFYINNMLTSKGMKKKFTKFNTGLFNFVLSLKDDTMKICIMRHVMSNPNISQLLSRPKPKDQLAKYVDLISLVNGE